MFSKVYTQLLTSSTFWRPEELLTLRRKKKGKCYKRQERRLREPQVCQTRREQHGFTKGSLCPRNLIAFCQEIPCFVSGKRTLDGVYLDWRKTDKNVMRWNNKKYKQNIVQLGWHVVQLCLYKKKPHVQEKAMRMVRWLARMRVNKSWVCLVLRRKGWDGT